MDQWSMECGKERILEGRGLTLDIDLMVELHGSHIAPSRATSGLVAPRLQSKVWATVWSGWVRELDLWYGHRCGWSALHPIRFSVQPCPRKYKEKPSLHYQTTCVLAKCLLVHNNNYYHVLNIYCVQGSLCTCSHSILTWGRMDLSRTLVHLSHLELFLFWP